MHQIRIARERQLMSQTTLARRAGLCPRTIVNIELGHSLPTIFSRSCICEVLGLPPERHLEIFGPVPEVGRRARDVLA